MSPRFRRAFSAVWPGLSAACAGTDDVALPGHAALSPGHTENKRISPRGRSLASGVPAGLLGMLALVLAFESYVARVDRDMFTTSIVQSWRDTGRAARREAKGSDVLFLGDSAVKFGLSPRLVESATGRKAFNLAPYGGPPAASYLLLKRAIDSGARPKAVVIDAMPHLLAVSPAHHLRPWQEIASPRECLDLGLSTHDPDFFAGLVVGRILPSWRDRHEIRENLSFAMSGLGYSNVISYWVTANRRNWWLNRGNELHPPNPKFPDDGTTDRPSLVPDHWALNEATVGYLHRVFSLCESRGIDVYWLLPPISPTPQAERGRKGLDRLYDDFARSMLVAHPSVVVVDARGAYYDRSAFLDPVHLTRAGNATLSLDVASFVRQRPGNLPRWNHLPRFQAPAVADAREDLEQSRVAYMQTLERRTR